MYSIRKIINVSIMSNDPIIVECPHCKQLCEIIELNCRIFRCGIFKSNNTQIPPHSSKEICDNLKARDLIFGCGKPFMVIGEKHKVIVCGYI